MSNGFRLNLQENLYIPPPFSVLHHTRHIWLVALYVIWGGGRIGLVAESHMCSRE